MDDILFAEGFSIITDVKQGPDGYLVCCFRTKAIKNRKVWGCF